MSSPPPSSSFAKRCSIFNGDNLRPLFKFSQLTQLHFEVVCTMTLTDKLVIDLGRALPCLEDLMLNGLYGCQTRSSVTFYGLFWLLALCPRLYEFGLAFDAEDLSAVNPTSDVPPEKRAPIPPPHDTSVLFVGDSRIRYPRKVATLLKDVFPRLSSIACWKESPDLPFDRDRAEEADLHRWRWKRVEEYMK
ncbi:hypothetical protein CONPUDRAFT_152675 [Coniophora puteana RWD-64-598 SS2]|uniref:F-box domain-containing protein n=1 Tax=Coniophora puteana (strain RWD-64-598) TaxID=741705 RepID=A0A5M3MTB9_CONPW|nr:uncharacterized protein CONPUDRAFT_152675 [Coniophora puteana RWD-64-598 SS2]EIW81771.1 hypothetical protein CONPUDRAFT_152675 [Coniophora puteana RWD-64-598 SS2]